MVDVRRITSILKVEVDGQVLVLTEDQAEDLCISLEQTLFDEPTYDELNDKVMALRIENERLKDELTDLKEYGFIPSQVGKYDRIMKG